MTFATQPSNAIGGSPFVTQPVVIIQDAGNNTVATDTNTIALTVHSGPGALSGCSATTTAGTGSFSGCSINTAGTYTLTATDAGDALTATSTSFDVGTGVASQLVVTTSPAGATGGTVFTTQPVVTVEDAGGNTVTGDTSTVTLSITGGTPSTGGPGALSGCAPTAASAGVATFTGCSINTEGTGYELHAVDGSLNTANSTPFDVTVGTASQIVFTVEPGNATTGSPFGTQPVVTIEDAGGNTVTTDTCLIQYGNWVEAPAQSLAAPRLTSGGVTTFNGCSIDTAGSFRLQAADATDALSDSATRSP